MSIILAVAVFATGLSPLTAVFFGRRSLSIPFQPIGY
jgi:hypothetical protein